LGIIQTKFNDDIWFGFIGAKSLDTAYAAKIGLNWAQMNVYF
jgi:hypothetical protein